MAPAPLTISDHGRNGQHDLCTSAICVRNLQIRFESHGALIHAGKSIVICPLPAIEDTHINTLSIVRNAHPEALLAKTDLCPNHGCFTVPARIGQSLLSDRINVVITYWVEIHRFPVNGGLEIPPLPHL